MGCVIANVKCSRLDVPIEVVTTRIGPLIEVVAHRLDESVVASVSRIDAPIFAKSIRLDEPIVVKCSIICDTWLGDVLRVSPEVMWLTEANDFTGVFEVTSNVDWVVVGDIAADDTIITYLHNADDISNTTMVSNIAISEYTHISNQLEFSNEVLIRNGEITIMTMFGNQEKVSNKSNIKNI